MKDRKNRPDRMDSIHEDIKRFSGDGLSVKMDCNHRILEVTGDGCRITLEKNSGSVRIIGDGCRLKIAHNVGDVEYNGDGGRVLLGPQSSRENVKYVGHGGKVTVGFDTKNAPSNGRTNKNSSDSRKDAQNTPSSAAAFNSDMPKLSNKTREKKSAGITCEMENLANERKERRMEKRYECEKSKKSIVATETIVTMTGNGVFVKKWLVGPSAMVTTLDNGRIVKTVKRIEDNVGVK
ncbi:hypothetical protein KM043_010411 [Ampulex compressa]|nr:hypothetical protein KM043_010411 [Ampulex compressa]